MASAHGPAMHGRGIGARGSAHELPSRHVLLREGARYLGAISVVVVGIIHAQQYYYAYFSSVPTIGTLFVLSFVGSGVFGAALIAPVRRLGRSIGDLVLVLAALGGIGVAFGSLVSLLISEYTPLFGFMESGYRLAVQLTIIFDSLTTLLLGLFVYLVVREHLQARAHDRAAVEQ